MSARDDLPWVTYPENVAGRETVETVSGDVGDGAGQPAEPTDNADLSQPRPAAWETMERSELVEIAMNMHRVARDYQRRYEQARATIARVQVMHAEDDDAWCKECGHSWPCRTNAVLDAER